MLARFYDLEERHRERERYIYINNIAARAPFTETIFV
jgi:hypothetical protein